MPTKLNPNTYVSIGLFIACMGAVFMFGVQKQRIDDLSDRMSRQEAYAEDVATMKEQIRQFGSTLIEIKGDVKDIKAQQQITLPTKK